jgi:hypothetical protein
MGHDNLFKTVKSKGTADSDLASTQLTREAVPEILEFRNSVSDKE